MVVSEVGTFTLRVGIMHSSLLQSGYVFNYSILKSE